MACCARGVLQHAIFKDARAVDLSRTESRLRLVPCGQLYHAPRELIFARTPPRHPDA